MRIPEAVQLISHAAAAKIVRATLEGRSISIRASDVEAARDAIPDPRSQVWTGDVCVAYLASGRELKLRGTRAELEAEIESATSTATGGDFALAVALGLIPGWDRVHKFGKALDVDTGPGADVWDGADTVPTGNKTWDRPDAAGESHTIAGCAADTAAGTGMQAAKIYGLLDWSTAEVTEDVEMNGAGGVTTVNDYVIIHRMRGIRFGSGGTNAAIITATGDTSGNVTAAIQPGNGQTLMAIYGVPSGKTMLLTGWARSVLRGGAGATIDASIFVDERPDQSDSGFLVKDVFSTTDGDAQTLNPPVPYTGPLLIKIRAQTTAVNTEVSASFNAYLVDG